MNDNKSALFVGSRQFQVKDEANDIVFPVLVYYPSLQPSSVTPFGPYSIDVSTDAKIIDGQFPLVIISHGNSGSPFLYRTISTFLAKNGYIVAMLEHYGNNRNNNELEKSIKNLQYRPRHLSLTIDYLLSENVFGQSLATDKIGVIGHSFGGYTALAIAGGTPWLQSGQQIEVHNDPRIKALILMAPAAAYYLPENSLDQVNIPILLFIAEKDQYTPKKWTADVILNGVPDKSKVTLKTIKNAGHFSFISPFPPTMKSPNFLPSTDPEGFDREAFHQELPLEILDFLEDKINKIVIA
jgi:predicted dienelactone hydrolase